MPPSAAAGKHGKSIAGVLSMLPTPAARDYRGSFAENSEAYQARMKHPRGVNPVEQLQRVNNGKNTGMKLHSDFVGYLMGYPLGWLDV
jgi:hypothetical protein